MKNKLIKALMLFISIILLIQLNIYAESNNLTINVNTDKETYKVEDEVLVTVSWNKGMQAASFNVNYNKNYLSFSEASIGSDFYNVEDGKIEVSWCSFEEIDCTQMTFKFIALKEGNNTISVTNPRAFADENLVIPTGYNYSNATKNIAISEKSYILDDIVEVNLLNNKLVLNGFNYVQDTFVKLSDLKNVIVTGTNYKVFDKQNNEITNNDSIIGTGTKLRIYKNDEVEKEYTIIIYGDTTGDGRINAIDSLAIIKDINDRIKFSSEEYREAGRVMGNNNLSAVDALAIIKYTNQKHTISQSKIKD